MLCFLSMLIMVFENLYCGKVGLFFMNNIIELFWIKVLMNLWVLFCMGVLNLMWCYI